LMLTPDDTVKVTDFGTAKILQFGTVQQTAHVMGTPSYMSPEQVKGRAVDGRSDIFSLGVMLYEMVTGEKPFPGQNITTVIYKIVNEEPVPPKQVDPTIHAGISAVVMKALAKDPDVRYQSCREMLEDLRNYRSLTNAGNPQSTMMLSGDAVNATVALGAPGLRGMHNDDLVGATARSLASRAANPSQTPVLRRTGTLAVVPEPKPKKSIWGSVLIGLLLLGVIGYCAKKLLPVYYDVRQQHEAPAPLPNGNGSATAQSASAEAVAPPAGDENPGTASETEAASNPVAEVTPTPSRMEKSQPKNREPLLTPKAAEYKGRIDEAISERGLSSRVKVQGAGSTLTVAGKLRPAEYGALLKFLHDAPPDVHIIDHIEYVDAPAATPSTANNSGGGRPIPGRGFGAIYVVTDVIGATAMLHDPSGSVVSQCQTPCSFNNLVPDRYSLEVKKEGYQPVQTALQVKQGKVADQRLSMESIAKGLLIASDPPGADVFINGAKQSGQTPVLLPLAAGQYNLVLRLPGHDPYVGSVQVKDNVQTQLNTKLIERSSSSRVAFADVKSSPAGAEIFVDGNSTGRFTPARIELPTGIHNVILRLNGFQPFKRTVQTTEGGTLSIEETLRPK
jgi:hypothetical protein